MCVCMCECMCACMCACMCVHVRTYVHAIHFLTNYHSSLCYFHMQTLIGISWAEALTDSFSSAVLKSVSDAVGVSDSAVSGTVVAVRASASTKAHKLLADINMNYNLSIFTNLSSIQTVNKLQTSFDNGAFLTSLRTFSGINITALASVMVQDASLIKIPTTAPTPFIQASAAVVKKGTLLVISNGAHVKVRLSSKLSYVFYYDYDYYSSSHK